MIENTYGKAKMVICDSCGDGFEAENWTQTKRRMAYEDWKIRRVDGKVVHYCPECGGAQC
jgi:hypothetical protein